MADSAVAGRVTHVHRTLEQIAFLLALLLYEGGPIGSVVGGSAILLLVVNSFSRRFE